MHHRGPRLYDDIGVDYRRFRRPDPRIARRLHDYLGIATRVLNVGAGTGSYEPSDRQVVALEPSLEMIRQRRSDSAPVIQAVASHLPFNDGIFSAAMALLTLKSGDWRLRHPDLLTSREIDAGYRLVVAPGE